MLMDASKCSVPTQFHFCSTPPEARGDKKMTICVLLPGQILVNLSIRCLSPMMRTCSMLKFWLWATLTPGLPWPPWPRLGISKATAQSILLNFKDQEELADWAPLHVMPILTVLNLSQ
eukprot:GGOE01016040.1.p1 GENE.GGOE01016040.1~~GGOE01016040.1.p1  ORF type:complete len:118 (+),score=8.22 GGOE01016040.1:176-529(+)